MGSQRNWLQLILTSYRARLKTTEYRYHVSITELQAHWCFDINWKRTLCLLELKFLRLSTHLLKIHLRIPFWCRFNLSFKPPGKPGSLHLYLIQQEARHNKLNKNLERQEVLNLNSTHGLLATDTLFSWRNLGLLQMRNRGGSLPSTYKCFLSVWGLRLIDLFPLRQTMSSIFP